MKTRTIRVDYLARVEGEGALTLRVRGDEVVSAELRIFEPPRLFEAFLVGRACTEVPDITARICGICPVAYQMSSCQAIENALGMSIPPVVAQLRRLLYCGEWIESHVLHMVMLHAPDFLGLPDVMALAKLHPERVRSGLRIKKAGNAIVAALGGREIHPINVRVGGFYRAPRAPELRALLPELEWALGAAEELVEWMRGFEFPAAERDYEFVSLRHHHHYPFGEGRIVSTSGLDIDPSEYEAHFTEFQVPHSHALHTSLGGKAIFCGPMARFNHNVDRLTPRARRAAERAELRAPCLNPFRSLLVRGVEVIFALEEAIRIIGGYEVPEQASVAVTPRGSRGYGCTEAPRGLLYHRYTLTGDGTIVDANIVPPTSQNQRTIEEDLLLMGKVLAQLPLAEARARAERVVRNYDPCISCATHFLDLRFETLP